MVLVYIALHVAFYFDLDSIQAKKIIKKVGRVVNDWCQKALKLKIKKSEIDRMASAFEHKDFNKLKD